MAQNMDVIRRAIADVVRDRFDTVNIVQVEVEEGLDHDGEAAFFVRVIFDADAKDLPAERLSGIKRHLRSSLEKLGEHRFPYTRFTPPQRNRRSSGLTPADLILTANKLVRGTGKPRQSDMKRAVSTVCYAVFHALCRSTAGICWWAGPKRYGPSLLGCKLAAPLTMGLPRANARTERSRSSPEKSRTSLPVSLICRKRDIERTMTRRASLRAAKSRR